MKTKSNLWRMLVILILTFLWGGGMSVFAAKKAWVKYDSDAKTLTFYYNEKGNLAKNEFNIPGTEYSSPEWNTGNQDTKYIRDAVEKVVFDKSFASVRPARCISWFNGFTKLTTIEGLAYLNTSEVTTMNYMFAYCQSLTSLDLTSFDTQKVTSMLGMFRSCSGLKSLDLSSFNTQKVTRMESMFSQCYNLETIYTSSTFVVDNVTESSDMFFNCPKLKGDIAFNSSYTDKTYATVDGGYFTDKVYTRPWVKYADGTLSFNYGYKKDLGSNEYLLNEVAKEPGWMSQNPNVTKVVFNPNFALVRPTSCNDWFHNCKLLDSKNITGLNYLNTSEVKSFRDMFWNCSKITELDLSSFNTEKSEDMAGMFRACGELTSLNISNFKTDNVTDMIYMFYECSKLESLDLSKFNTQKVTGMECMFGNCNSLKSLTISNFDTQNVTNMKYMFENCSALESLNLSSFNTPNLQSMEYMFYCCSALKSLNLSKFNTGKVTSMSRLFYNCSSLESLDISGFNTANLTQAPSMFNGCSNLKTIDVSSFNTAKMDNMGHMFANCTSLTTLDLTNFNTASVKWIDNMFKDCSNLTTIYASENFALGSSVQNSAGMFTGCTKLVGAIAYDANKVDKTYAKLDGGYFTDKVYTRPWAKLVDGTLTFQYGYKKTLNNEEYPMNDAWDKPEWYSKNRNVTKVVFDSSFAYARPTTCYSWFANCENLTDVEGVRYLTTSEVTVMNSMFWYCSKLASLDLSSFDTRKATNINYMFSGCSNLKYIYVGDKFVNATTPSGFVPSSSVFYCNPNIYNTTKANPVFKNSTVKPYVPINANAEYGTLCVPLGSTLAESSFSGFDKLYQIKSADKDKGVISLVETESIEPGVAYVYHRNLPENATESIITFDADASATAAAPKNDDSLLKGTFEQITAPGGSYILQTDGMFHPVAAGNTTLSVGAYRAYLDLSSLDGGNSKTFRMVFEDSETTDINGISDNPGLQPRAHYDLMGRRVTTPKAGEIYIVNGKKVVYNK